MQTFSDRIDAAFVLTSDSTDPTSFEALVDVLFLIEADEVTCGLILAGVSGPGGSLWAFGEDADLPPWISEAELCSADAATA